MPRGSSGAGLLPCRDRVRGLRTRPRRHDHRRRAGVARVRLGPAGVAGAGRATEHDHGPRQGPLDLHRMAEQGRVWTADPYKSRAQIYRLRKWQHRIRTSKSGERSLAQGLTEINTMASKMGLPRHVRENAAVLYRRASTKNLVRGRSIDEVVAATLYASCRQSGVPRTLDEIASKSSVDRKSIGRTYRTLVRELGLKLLPQSPRDYIARFCNRLELDMDVQRKAKEILDKVEKDELASGVAPSGVAAATIYISAILCNKPCTQKEVAEVAGVTEVTIRNRYKRISVAIGMVR